MLWNMLPATEWSKIGIKIHPFNKWVTSWLTFYPIAIGLHLILILLLSFNNMRIIHKILSLSIITFRHWLHFQLEKQIFTKCIISKHSRAVPCFGQRGIEKKVRRCTVGEAWRAKVQVWNRRKELNEWAYDQAYLLSRHRISLQEQLMMKMMNPPFLFAIWFFRPKIWFTCLRSLGTDYKRCAGV